MRTVRRWVLRLLAVLALGGVTYGVVRIVQEGTGDGRARPAVLVDDLKALARAQAALGTRLERLRPGREAPRLLPAARAAQRAHARLVRALRARQERKLPVPDERRLEEALAVEFDYLDAVGSTARNRRSPLQKTVADRAQAAKDAFTGLDGSQGVEDGIRGTQSFLTWARARH